MASIPPVGEDDLQALRRLLSDAGLPTDVGEHRETLVAVARDGDEVIGGVAVEIYGEDGLLRSLVVGEAYRSAGLGTGLVGAAHATARDHDIATLFLLTETAADFFERFDYETVDRDEVPERVKESSEFAVHCPDSAAVLSKPL